MRTLNNEFPGVPDELVRSLERSREDIAAGRVADAKDVEAKIKARTEQMRDRYAPRRGMGVGVR